MNILFKILLIFSSIDTATTHQWC